MKRRCCLVLIWLVTVSLASDTPVLDASYSPQASAPQETQATIDGWARDNYDLTLDLVFQDRCTASNNVRWIACVRIIPGYTTELEYMFSVEKSYSGTVLARITRPKLQSIYAQLCKLKKEHPGAFAADLAKLIEVESQIDDQKRVPALVHLADEFEKLRLSPVLPDEIMMDATKYIFRSRSFSGDQIEFVLRGPGSSAPHQPQPVIQWAESAKEMLASTLK